jgi:hypothetical protein
MADKEFTYSDVSEHNTKKDLYIVVHDKVYNASSFVDEHPYVRPLSAPRLLPHWFAHDVSKRPAIIRQHHQAWIDATIADYRLQRW